MSESELFYRYMVRTDMEVLSCKVLLVWVEWMNRETSFDFVEMSEALIPLSAIQIEALTSCSAYKID